MGSLKALATQKTGKIEERAKLEKYPSRKNPTSSSSCMGSLKALATQKTGKIEEHSKLENYLIVYFSISHSQIQLQRDGT